MVMEIITNLRSIHNTLSPNALCGQRVEFGAA